MFAFDESWGSLGTSILVLVLILDLDFLPDYLPVSYDYILTKMKYWAHLSVNYND